MCVMLLVRTFRGDGGVPRYIMSSFQPFVTVHLLLSVRP